MVGWAGARRDFQGARVEIDVDLLLATDLPVCDFASVHQAPSRLLGVNIVVVD